MRKPSKLLIASGGTGGHFYPALALGKELEKRGVDILFAIRANDSTANRLSVEKFKFEELPAAPFLGQSMVKILRGMFVNLWGVVQAWRLLGRYPAEAAACFGAYVSAPVAVAAFLRGIPLILHEQNVVPGWSNRFCSLFARKVAVSFKETESAFGRKAFLTGNLVREELFALDRKAALARLGLDPTRKTILVFGGSGGARNLNKKVGESLEHLNEIKNTAQFLHLTGHAEDTEKLKTRYASAGFKAVVMDYSNEMHVCYACADLAVCRSGATTLSELVVVRVPALFVPYPHAGGHQLKNAAVLERIGAAEVILESDRLARDLADALKRILSSEKLGSMRSSFARFPVALKEAPSRLADALCAETEAAS